jgi:RNA polymerase sigma-70 factor (ECF subfamily)
MTTDPFHDPFTAHRSLLFTVAYEMLGSAADADDVVQETWLRWAEVAQAAVHDPRAYLVRIVTRQAARGVRRAVRRDRRGGGQVERSGPADRAPGT